MVSHSLRGCKAGHVTRRRALQGAAVRGEPLSKCVLEERQFDTPALEERKRCSWSENIPNTKMERVLFAGGRRSAAELAVRARF